MSVCWGQRDSGPLSTDPPPQAAGATTIPHIEFVARAWKLSSFFVLFFGFGTKHRQFAFCSVWISTAGGMPFHYTDCSALSLPWYCVEPSPHYLRGRKVDSPLHPLFLKRIESIYLGSCFRLSRSQVSLQGRHLPERAVGVVRSVGAVLDAASSAACGAQTRRGLRRVSPAAKSSVDIAGSVPASE